MQKHLFLTHYSTTDFVGVVLIYKYWNKRLHVVKYSGMTTMPYLLNSCSLSRA